MEASTILSRRAIRAVEILKTGGYFRKQLETQHRGGEKFEYRLRDVAGQSVTGFGFQTWNELESAGLLQWRECPRSTVWPSEWTLRPVALDRSALGVQDVVG